MKRKIVNKGDKYSYRWEFELEDIMFAIVLLLVLGYFVLSLIFRR